MNRTLITYSMIATTLLTTACATPQSSILLGAGIGAGAGGAVGYGVGKSPQSTLIGAGSGAVVGGLVGYLAHKGKSKKTDGIPTTIQPAKPDLPFLTKPEVRSIWVPDKIEGNQYIQGHYIFVIEKQSNWSQK